MQCFLQDTDYAIQSDLVDARVNNWFAEIRKLAYETEDILETYVIQVSSKRNKKAIIVLGGLLATKHTLREWEVVYQNVRSHKWSDDPIQHDNGVSTVLALSYHDLPYQLKPCFLYFGHFPEDYRINAERLYHLWIGDGIIVDDDRVGDETIMDVAKRYLANCFSTTTSTTTAPKIRKLAIHLNRDVERVVLPELETTKHLRSILFCNSRSVNSKSSIELNSHLKYFKLLRNWDLEAFKFDEKSVESIGNLISLSDTITYVLPFPDKKGKAAPEGSISVEREVLPQRVASFLQPDATKRHQCSQEQDWTNPWISQAIVDSIHDTTNSLFHSCPFG
ncbi:hypothetical protein ACSBR2_041872 [Camellia fascicularis]